MDSFAFCGGEFRLVGWGDKMAIPYIYKRVGDGKVEENNLFLKNIGFYFAVWKKVFNFIIHKDT